MGSATGLTADILAKILGQLPKCPSPFVSLNASACVMPCPADKGFVRENGKCVYSADKQHTVTLVTVGPAIFTGSTLDNLRTADAAKYGEFVAEKDRFDREIATVYANIDKNKKINDAFRVLQAAENARDQSPEAYQIARTTYYTLVKGQKWLNEERERITRSEVNPEIQRYRSTIEQIQMQNNQQKKTMDVVQAVKDKVVSLRDDFKYSADVLYGQLEKLKTQINMNNRSRPKPTEDNFWVWLDTVLNVVLVAVLAFAGWIAYSKMRPASPTPIPAPAYTLQA